APDGESIAFTATVPMQERWPIDLPERPAGANWTADPLVVERLHFRIDGEGLKSGFDHIFVVRTNGGEPRQVTFGEWDVGARAAALNTGSRLEWSTDGDSLFFDGFASDISLGMSSHIYRLDVRSGDIRQLTVEDGFWSSPRVSAGGEYLAYVGYAGTTPDQQTYPGYQIRVMRTDGSDDKAIHSAWEGRIYTQVAAVADFFEWRGDGRGLYMTSYAKGLKDVAFISLDGEVSSTTKASSGFDISSVSNDGLAAGVVTTPHSPANLATARLVNGDVRQLTEVNSELLKDIQLGAVEEIWYESDSGIKVQGWIVTPPDFDLNHKYPLVLSIHGGPHAMYGPSFSFSFQDFAARGYVVLYTNPRGSLGYGIDFANSINDSITGDEGLNDLMAGVDTVLERGYVDAERLNVTGCSGGGVMTNWIVTQTNRFKAAAALCSISNWISFAGTADIVIGAHHFFDDRFW
ncbi:MAG: S9 family peptidase, partial [Woeseiaceae bacterium]